MSDPGRSSAVLLAVALASVGCGAGGRDAGAGQPAAAPPAGDASGAVDEAPPRRPNVVLLTVDTLRPDHLGVYGYGRPTSPLLDAFAADGAVFPEAFAVSAWTFPGLASVMTGVYPATHGFDARGRAVDPGLPNLQRRLRAAGYRVPGLSYVGRVPGLEALEVEDPWEGSRETEPGGRLLEWLRSPAAGEGPFLAWYHYRSLHLPYEPPPRRAGLFGAPPDTPAIEQVRSHVVIPAELQSFRPGDRAHVVDLYDANLRAFDDFFGEMLEALRQGGLLDETIVVVTADHGEEFLEHGILGHASTSRHAQLYDEVMRIPLIVRVPGEELTAPGCQVSQVDVLPTLLSLVGLPPVSAAEGLDLAPVLRGEEPCPDRPVFAESILGGFQAEGPSARSFLWAVRTPTHKLLLRRDRDGGEARELYDLGADPGEQRDLAAERPERARELEELLREFLERRGGVDYWRRPVEESPGARREARTVAAAPVVLDPVDGARLSFDDTGGMIRGRWTGSPTAVYVLEYEVGDGHRRTTGKLEIEGTSFAYGPVPLEVWEGMTQFNPWRFRLVPELAPDKPSEWITVHLETGAAE